MHQKIWFKNVLQAGRTKPASPSSRQLKRVAGAGLQKSTSTRTLSNNNYHHVNPAMVGFPTQHAAAKTTTPSDPYYSSLI
jgi:hypothetical protein